MEEVMVDINDNTKKFIKKLKERVGIRKISKKELLKLLRYFDVIGENSQNINMKEINSICKLDIVENDVFMIKKSQFKLNDIVSVCKRGRGQNLYETKLLGQVIGIYNTYIIVKFDNYNETILYNCMYIGEYLVFKGVRKQCMN